MKFVVVIKGVASITEAYNLKVAKSDLIELIYDRREVGTYSIYKCITQRSKPTQWVCIEGIWGYDAAAPLQSYEAVYKTHEKVNHEVLDNYRKLHEACLWLSMQEGVSSGNYYGDGGYFQIGGAIIRIKDHDPRSRGWESSHNIIVDGRNLEEGSYTYTTFDNLLGVVKRIYEKVRRFAIEAGTYNKDAESNPKYIIRNLLALAQKRIPKPLPKPEFSILVK